MPDVEITQQHRTKGRASASTFLVECAVEDAGEFMPVAMVSWYDTCLEMMISEVDVGDATHKAWANALRNFPCMPVLWLSPCLGPGPAPGARICTVNALRWP